jgi:benzoate-CoA ligase
VSERPIFPDLFNMAHYFLDARLEEGLGDRLAVIDDHGRYRYSDVQAMANQVAHALWSRGVRAEERVLIGLFDGIEFVAALFGILKVGAVVTMVNPELPDGDYDYYLSYTRARAAILDGTLAARIAPALARAPLLRTVIATAFAPSGTELWSEAITTAPTEFENRPTSKDDPAMWLFTSGSTGKPKGAVHLHHDFPYNTECYAKRVLAIASTDVTVAVPKLFFGYATGSNLLFPFSVGATVVLFRDRATPERLFDLVKRHRATVLTSVPTMINKMSQTEVDSEVLRSLRVCISAGEALPEELYHRFRARFGVEILDGIGSAEMFHIYISNRFGEVKPGSLGRIVPGYEVRLVGEEGRELPPGEIGTLWVKGDSAAVYYFQEHEKSKSVLRGDWVVSGDLFRRDEEDFFYYAGRADDLLKVGGIFVSPIEVEGCLLRHPGVHEAALIGYEDDEGLVKTLAYVVPRGVTPSETLADDIIRHARAELAHYKVPRRIEFVEALPRSDRGKVLRRELRK